MSETGRYVSAATALLGAWLVFSVLVVFQTEPAHFWNDVVVGGAILVLAGYNFVVADERTSISVVVAFVVALLGVWQIIAALNFAFLGALDDLIFWSDAVAGGLVALLASYNVYQGRFVSLEEEAEEARS